MFDQSTLMVSPDFASKVGDMVIVGVAMEEETKKRRK